MDVARQRKNAVTAYLVYVVLFYAILIGQIEPFFSYSSTFGLIGNLLAFPMYWTSLKIHQGDCRWTWIWFTATGVLYFIGDLLWAYHADVLGVEPESPSICDIFYLLNSYACCCAFICYIRQIKKLDAGSAFFDILITVIALGGLLFRFIIQPLIQDSSIGLFQMFLHANMSVIDLALFMGILMVIFGTARSRFFSKRTLLLGLSFFACCFVEQFSLAIEVYDLPIGAFFDPFWAAPFWLFALTGMYPDEDEVGEEEKTAFHRKWGKIVENACVVLPYIMTALVIWLVGIREASENGAFCLVMVLMAGRIAWSLFLHARRTPAAS